MPTDFLAYVVSPFLFGFAFPQVSGHAGECYGKSGYFIAAAQQLWRLEFPSAEGFDAAQLGQKQP